MYKGHPQPSVDERLKEARNFLADEDVNRCLDFKAKLAQIDQFLQHVEEKNLPRNKYLFGDVKAMVDVQKDWTDRMDKPPADVEGPDAPSISSHSTRLINIETAAQFQLQREAYGVVTQMRDDHPPFTVNRSSDQVHFLNKMVQDASTDPDELDTATNLLFVEYRAYDWALREPALIPYWMHWKKGLPTKGIKPTDPKPWYRENPRIKNVPSAPAPRPHNFFPREVLPDFLQHREDEINRLLRSHQPGTVSSSLADLLIYHAPAALQELRREHDDLTSIQDLLSAEERAKLTTVTATLDKEFNEWVEALRPAGVQIRISKTKWADADTPGIFYIADAMPRATHYKSLDDDAKRINSLLSLPGPSARQQEQLRDMLDPFIPAEIRRCDDRAQAILNRAGKKTHAAFSKLSKTQQGDFNKLQLGALTKIARTAYFNAKAQKSTLFESWLETLRARKVNLKYIRPGEIHTASPGYLYCPWKNPIVEEQLLQVPPPDVRQIESDINDCLYEMETRGKDKTLNARLDSLLKPIIYSEPLGNEPAKPKWDAPAYQLLKECLVSRKIEIRIPQHSSDEDFQPKRMFYRGPNDGIRHPVHQDNDLSRWAREIKKELRGQGPTAIAPLDNLNTWEEKMYDLLAHLQYPFLKRMDITWRALGAVSSVDANTVEEFRTSWIRGFKAWLAIILNPGDPISVLPTGLDDDARGDPGILYYRGDITEPDFQSDEENQNAIPEDIQKRANQIDVLMNEYTKKPTKDTKALETLLKEFWRPVREHEDHQDFSGYPGLTFDEIEQLQGWEEEYNKRLLLLIQESTKVGFKLKMHRSGTYKAEDPTEKLTEQWRVRGDHRTLDRSPQPLRKLLNYLWVYPKRFYRALRDLEVEINDCLEALTPTSSPTDEHSTRLLQLMRPFLPHALAELASQLESAFSSSSLMTRAVEPQHVTIQASFITLYAQWLRQLQRYGRTKWIKILVWDPVELSSPSFTSLEGRVYFPRPSTSNVPMDQDNHVSNQLPVRFKRYERDINYLLHRRKLHLQFPEKPFTFKENDRLRQLLHLAMNPITAKADRELRALDEQSRVGIMQGEELTSYLSKIQTWQTKYNQWVDSFPDEGIELRALGEDTQRSDDKPDMRYIYIEQDQLLPPPFRKYTLPLHVQRMRREFKTALRAKSLTNLEKKAISDRYGPLVKSSYQEEFNDLREYFFLQQYPDKVHLNGRALPSSETVAIIQCVEDLAFQAIWARLKSIATKEGKTGVAMEIYEPQRGELRIRLQPLKSRDISKGEGDLPKQKPALMIPCIDEARLEFVPLAKKVQDGLNLTGAERAEISRQFIPLSEKDRVAEIEQVIGLVLKAYDGTQLTDTEEAQAKPFLLKSLWQNFERICPRLVERACPGLKYGTSMEGFLDLVTPGFIRQPTTLPPYPAPTEAEVREVGTEINNLLQKFRDGTILDNENHVLDNLLRPLVNHRLRELGRQMDGLALITTSTDRNPIPSYESHQLNSQQSLYLLELQTQWAVEFEKWKTNLPGYGVIIDEWYSEPDVVPNVISRYRAVRDALGDPPEHTPKIQESREMFLILKRYITDSTFTDKDGNLMLERLPADVASLRDVLFDRRETLNAQNRRLSLSESLSLNLLEHEFVTRYLTWYNAVPVGMPHTNR